MRILVTGGAGYLGSVLVDHLLNGNLSSVSVTVVDNFMWGQASLNHLCRFPNLDIVRGDVRDPHVMRPLIEDADLIIPLAALVGAPLCERDPTGATSTNVDAIRMMMQWIKPDQKIIAPISNSGYGVGEPGKLCTEESPLKPISLYGITKVKAEDMIMAGPDSISLRLATVFGMSPRMRLDLLVNDFVYRAVRDKSVVLFEGDFMRNFIHVRDVARAFSHAIHNFRTMRGQIYNVGLSDANTSKTGLCIRIQRHIPGFTFVQAATGKDPDQRNYIVSNAKIEATGYKPAYSLDDGIKELIKGYQGLSNTRYGNV